jgi:hypothetical protein
MKATFQIPDELYREVKVQTAREGKTVREVTIRLFEQWLRQKKQPSISATSVDWLAFQPPLSGHVPADVNDHGMNTMRETISQKWNEPT